jgi:hypothetical protein
MTSFTRTSNRVSYDWRRAVDLALMWVYQTGRRHRVQGHPLADGSWMWVIKKTDQPWPADRAERIAEARRVTGYGRAQ